jgi:hypothetical protein
MSAFMLNKSNNDLLKVITLIELFSQKLFHIIFVTYQVLIHIHRKRGMFHKEQLIIRVHVSFKTSEYTIGREKLQDMIK